MGLATGVGYGKSDYPVPSGGGLWQPWGVHLAQTDGQPGQLLRAGSQALPGCLQQWKNVLEICALMRGTFKVDSPVVVLDVFVVSSSTGIRMCLLELRSS